MKNSFRIILLFALFQFFAGVALTQNNGSFEQWDSVWTHVYATDLTLDYGVINPQHGDATWWKWSYGYGVCRTIDAVSGQYALILHNWYTYVTEEATYHDSITYSPGYLLGYYKYITDVTNFGGGFAKVAVTRWNGSTTDTLGSGMTVFDTATAYRPFEIPVTYGSTLQPDSVLVYFQNAVANCLGENVCHLLYLDSVRFSNTPLGVTDFSQTFDLSIYPNPVQDRMYIRANDTRLITVQVMDMQGRLLMEKRGEDLIEMDAKDLPSLVIVRVRDESRREMNRMVVVE